VVYLLALYGVRDVCLGDPNGPGPLVLDQSRSASNPRWGRQPKRPGVSVHDPETGRRQTRLGRVRREIRTSRLSLRG